MSPVALYSATSVESDTTDKTIKSSSMTTPTTATATATIANDISRRPSPWHEIAHSLSTASTAPPSSGVASRRVSSPNLVSGPLVIGNSNTKDRGDGEPPSPSPALSTSQALRDWEERLKSPESDAKRHQLVHAPATFAQSQPHPQPHPYSYPYSRSSPSGSRLSPALPPKLAAERDKEGHIEYKLKLIEPSPERFGKLVTQMMWRLKQGKNEAIYELGLAGESGPKHQITHILAYPV